jgi:hypothetical protein
MKLAGEIRRKKGWEKNRKNYCRCWSCFAVAVILERALSASEREASAWVFASIAAVRRESSR